MAMKVQEVIFEKKIPIILILIILIVWYFRNGVLFCCRQSLQMMWRSSEGRSDRVLVSVSSSSTRRLERQFWRRLAALSTSNLSGIVTLCNALTANDIVLITRFLSLF